MDKKVCAHCGKELGTFGKIKTKDGYLCKKCSKKYETILEKQNRTFETLTYIFVI